MSASNKIGLKDEGSGGVSTGWRAIPFIVRQWEIKSLK